MLYNLLDKNCARIILLFATSPGRNHRRKEIQKWTNLNNVPLDISLNKLSVLKILREKDNLYSFNLESEIVQKLIEEEKLLLNVPLKVQFALIDSIDALSKIWQIKNIILFGSYSKLIFTDKSDMDLAIILGNNVKDKEKIEKQIFAIAKKLSKKHKKEIHYTLFSESDLKHKEDLLIKDIVQNGKVLI
jgi:DNA polymerase sigma